MQQPARLPLRALAYLIDAVPIVIGVTIVFFAFFGLGDALAKVQQLPHDPDARAAYLDIRLKVRTVAFAGIVLYGMLMECSPLQGTLGKYICGMKVVDGNGDRLSFLHSVYRNTAKLLSYAVLLLGFFWAFFNPMRQTWHDSIARTYVVKRGNAERRHGHRGVTNT